MTDQVEQEMREREREREREGERETKERAMVGVKCVFFSFQYTWHLLGINTGYLQQLFICEVLPLVAIYNFDMLHV